MESKTITRETLAQHLMNLTFVRGENVQVRVVTAISNDKWAYCLGNTWVARNAPWEDNVFGAPCLLALCATENGVTRFAFVARFRNGRVVDTGIRAVKGGEGDYMDPIRPALRDWLTRLTVQEMVIPTQPGAVPTPAPNITFVVSENVDIEQVRKDVLAAVAALFTRKGTSK